MLLYSVNKFKLFRRGIPLAIPTTSTAEKLQRQLEQKSPASPTTLSETSKKQTTIPLNKLKSTTH